MLESFEEDKQNGDTHVKILASKHMHNSTINYNETNAP